MQLTAQQAEALEAEYLRGLHQYGGHDVAYEGGWAEGFTAALETLGIGVRQVPMDPRDERWTDHESRIEVEHV